MLNETIIPAIITNAANAALASAKSRRKAILVEMHAHIEEHRANRSRFLALSPSERAAAAFGDYQGIAYLLSARLRAEHLARCFLRGTAYRSAESKCNTTPDAWLVACVVHDVSRPDSAMLDQVKAWLAA